MKYIFSIIVIYIISISIVKKEKEKKFSKQRKYFSYHNINPYPKKNHFHSIKKKTCNSINTDIENHNMHNLLKNEQMIEYMMWHDYWSHL